MVANTNHVIIKVYRADKDSKEKIGSLYVPTFMKPLAYNAQVGEVLSVGAGVENIQIGDALLFHHTIEDIPENIVSHVPDQYDIRALNLINRNCPVYGIVRDGVIIPEKGFVLAKEFYLQKSKLITFKSGITMEELIADENTAFQTTIVNVSLVEEFFKKGDAIVCLPFSNYSIKVGEEMYWFIDKKHIVLKNSEKESIFILAELQPKSKLDLPQRVKIKLG